MGGIVQFPSLAASALAHETWMMPSVFSAKVGGEVRFDVGSGMAFPRSESAVKVERVATGTYRLGQDVAEYLDEIDATADIRSIWAGQKGRVPWKETYTKHAKTFVAVGDAALELVPTTSPFNLETGREFTVELQANSKPVPGLPRRADVARRPLPEQPQARHRLCVSGRPAGLELARRRPKRRAAVSEVEK